MTTKKNEAPYEEWEQEQIFVWAMANQIERPEFQLLNGSLNGVRVSPKIRRKLKGQGVRKGFPDINLPVRRKGYFGLYIELKRVKGGVVSPEQKEWQKRLNIEGYLSVICRGHAKAIEVIEWYLGDPEKKVPKCVLDVDRMMVGVRRC